MFLLVRNNLLTPLSDEQIRQLAYKVATERVVANINIGDFVYNVNLGRSIIVKGMHQSGVSIHDLEPIVDDVNEMFNRFCYHAVKKYTDLKDQELQKKILFINETHKDRLSLLGQMSSSFVHEFRNPLTSVLGFIKLLKTGESNPMYLEVIEHELNELNFRVTQFLHTSKVRTHDSTSAKINIKSLIDELLKFLYPSIVDGDLEVTMDIDSEINIIAYPGEIHQVILNILMNAIDAVKHTEKPGRISITCRNEDNQIKLCFSNNGPTIKPQNIETIFEPFYTTKELGTGIGLYVCKKIIEKYNGSITCVSDDGLTTFAISFPLT